MLALDGQGSGGCGGRVGASLLAEATPRTGEQRSRGSEGAVRRQEKVAMIPRPLYSLRSTEPKGTERSWCSFNSVNIALQHTSRALTSQGKTTQTCMCSVAHKRRFFNKACCSPARSGSARKVQRTRESTGSAKRARAGRQCMQSEHVERTTRKYKVKAEGRAHCGHTCRNPLLILFRSSIKPAGDCGIALSQQKQQNHLNTSTRCAESGPASGHQGWSPARAEHWW